MINFQKRRAKKFHTKGQKLSDEGRESEAIEMYAKAIALDPKKSESYYNVGLIYKYRGDWEQSLKYNKIANELDPESEAARWNLAIAATALRRWDIARSAWIQNGLELEGDSGPIDMDFGITPVRLNPDTAGEVVWATRIDPVRARLDSVPFPESGFRYGDIVLHDGAPVGTRNIGDREYSVFNVLQRFQPSEFETAVAVVEITKDDDLLQLDEILSTGSHIAEDWTGNVRILCKQCSEGAPHTHHDSEVTKVWQSERRLGVAVCGGGNLPELFETWQKKTGARLISLSLGDEELH